MSGFMKNRNMNHTEIGNMKSSKKLERCSFCEGIVHLEDSDQMPTVVCNKCGAVISFFKEDYTEEQVVDLYNKKVTERALRRSRNFMIIAMVIILIIEAVLMITIIGTWNVR